MQRESTNDGPDRHQARKAISEGKRIASQPETQTGKQSGSQLVAMFDEIMRKFEGSPGQQRVIRLLLERGFSVNDEGRVVSGGIEIPDTQIADEVGVDRRVVDSTTDAILKDGDLRRIFQNISQIPSLMDLAPVLDLTVVVIEVEDADQPGIVADVTQRIADRGISLRQTISDDPEFSDEPRLYLVVDDELPGDLLTELLELDFVRRMELG